jgi:ArsR family transcriptional regulator, zinc-responsive transcriptional repressor
VAKQPKLLPMETLADACECLKVLAHPVRLRIVEILMQGEFQVHQVAALCDLPPHQTSEHLRLLQGRGLLAAQRRSRSVFYRVADPRLPALIGCIRSTCEPSAARRSARRATA